MVTMESSKESNLQQVVVLDKALKLAEGWVKQMNTVQDNAEDVGEVEIQIRPPRLGLGAKFLPHSQFAATLNPVEKKLRAKLNADKRRSVFSNESCSIDKENNVNKLKASVEEEEDDDDNSDSRANMFRKKKETCSGNSLQSLVASGKKRKRK